MAEIISGDIHGGLTALEEVSKCRWLVKCRCGKKVEMTRRDFWRLNTCGCRKKARNPYGNIHKGYVRVYSPDHPRSDKTGQLYEHTLVMEHIMGRYLVKGENVHHKNGIKTDNRPENLELWTTNQPVGARVEDKIAFALEILSMYKPEVLKDGVI
tara:strand:+ start:104 stop:568 length:465 start_codon:yes stop_codon:yes gene_type:complete